MKKGGGVNNLVPVRKEKVIITMLTQKMGCYITKMPKQRLSE